MTAHADDHITNEHERQAYRALSRVYGDFLQGTPEAEWPERTQHFVAALDLLRGAFTKHPRKDAER